VRTSVGGFRYSGKREKTLETLDFFSVIWSNSHTDVNATFTLAFIALIATFVWHFLWISWRMIKFRFLESSIGMPVFSGELHRCFTAPTEIVPKLPISIKISGSHPRGHEGTALIISSLILT